MLTTILIMLFTSLGSLIYIPVAESGFRITFGIVIFISALHIFKPSSPVFLSFIAGLCVCLTRIFFDSLSINMTSSLASNYLLETFFYFGYGLIYNWAVITNESEYPLPLVVALVISDTGGNTLEYIIRHLAADEVFANTSLYSIFLAAFVRSVLIVLFIWIFEILNLRRTLRKEQ